MKDKRVQRPPETLPDKGTQLATDGQNFHDEIMLSASRIPGYRFQSETNSKERKRHHQLLVGTSIDGEKEATK